MSDTSTDGATPPPAPSEGQPPAASADDELAKWKAQARENEKRAKANADAARRLAEIEESSKTETQKANDRAAAAERRAEEAERAALRAQVAMAKGLPPKLGARLQGDTQQEMEADADDLLAEIGSQKKQQTPPNFDGGSRKSADDGSEDMNKLLRRAAGRSE